MKKQLQKTLACLIYFFLFSFSSESVAQNVFSGEPIQVVGTMNGFNTSAAANATFRRVSVASGNPTDGRGQWTKTYNAQVSGGDVLNSNMPGGGGGGFLFISGPSTNRFQNKWAFTGVGQGGLNSINNNLTYNSGNDMGLNMSTTGRYTFVFNDNGYNATNTKFYVGYTANDPVTVSRTSQSYSGTQPVISITTNATPSSGESIYVRYRVGTNDFTASTFVVQATGSGTSWTATLPSQSCGTTLYYYVYTSTRSLSQINADSESDRSMATLRYDDSFGANYSTTLTAAITYYQDLDADGFGNAGVSQLSCTGVPSGYVTNNADCNDNQLQYQDLDSDGFGSLIQVACGVTNNSDCNDNQLQYQDLDGDGFGSTTTVACGVTNNADCNDNQIQYLDADNDSFGSTTQVACGVTNNSDCNDNQLQYQDLDGDGFGSTTTVACGVTNNADCNDNQIQYLDADNDSFGSTTQVACGVVNNSDCNDNQLQYQDLDGDGFGSTTTVACGVTNNADCNDNQIQYLDADNDSFGSTTQVACGVVNNSDCNDNQLQYQDLDGDGFGSTTTVACGVTNNADCNDNQIQYLDADNDSFGSTIQVACGVVNNSDCNDNQLQYQDLDGDGFGSNITVACGATNNSDCNDNQIQYLDADNDSFGSTTQVACGVVNNSDCNDNQLQYQDLDGDGFGSNTTVACGVNNNADCNDAVTYYTDNDGDGFGALPKLACGSVTNSTDCDDNNILVWQNGLFYTDTDGDGYSPTPGVTQTLCYGASGVGGFSLVLHPETDCDDTNATIYPGATEICYNGILENCNGTLSQGCAPVVVTMTPSYNNTTLPSLAIAVPAVPYSYAPYTNIKYRFRITNVTTGITAPDIIQMSRFITIPVSIHSYNSSYTITAGAVINEEILPFAGNTITVLSPVVQLITLSSASCGSTLATLTTQISANPGLNATSYTFRIRLNDANPTPVYGYSPSATRFVGANSFVGFPLQYSSSYKVAVQYTFNDPVTGLPVESGYGAECTLNTPSIPLRGLASPVCGSQVTTLNAGITSAVAPYATAYRFRIRLASDNGPTPQYYYTAPNASRFSSLGSFQGITYAYSTVYSIAVEYSIVEGMTTVWSGFGPECQITTPFFPVTSLVASQCGQPTATSLTQTLNITPYPGFPMYMVKLEEVEGETVTNTQELEFSYSYFRLNQFSIAQNDKSYSVSVKIKLNGVYGDYDTACDLFTAPIPTPRTIKPEFKASAYPNPFANNFMIDVKTSSESVVALKVYDMVGRLIEQREVRVLDLETTTIGDRYPSGVYNVVVSQEDSVQTVRVVKR